MKQKLFIVLILAVVAVGGVWFLRERQRTSVIGCVNNLRQIDGAKQQWAVDHNADGNQTPKWDDLIGKYFIEKPQCPQGGTYTIEKVNEPPRCSIGGPKHSLPSH